MQNPFFKQPPVETILREECLYVIPPAQRQHFFQRTQLAGDDMVL